MHTTCTSMRAPAIVIWVVAASHCVEVELLEELDILKHGLFTECLRQNL